MGDNFMQIVVKNSNRISFRTSIAHHPISFTFACSFQLSWESETIIDLYLAS